MSLSQNVEPHTAGYRKYLDYDPDAEAAILGTCMTKHQVYASVYTLLNEDCFYHPDHRLVYQAIRKVYESGAPVELITVARHFYDQGITEISGSTVPYYLCELMKYMGTANHVLHWSMLLRELSAKRTMIQLTSTRYQGDDVVAAAEQIQQSLQQALELRTTNDWHDASEAAIALTNNMDAQGRESKTISTTIESVDRLNGGFRPGQLVVIGARPSCGKSALAGNIALQAAKQERKVGILSLEMPMHDVFGRMVSTESNIPFRDIDRSRLQDEELTQYLTNNINKLAPLPIYFCETGEVTIHDIRARATQLKNTRGMDVLIIDYLQLIAEPQGTRSREQGIAQISRGLKQLAMELEVPIIALSQLNRESEHRANKRPTLADLRESGAIEQDADVVFLLHRDWRAGILTNAYGQSTEQEADLIIAKWRNGAIAEEKIHFDAPTMTFSQWRQAS